MSAKPYRIEVSAVFVAQDGDEAAGYLEEVADVLERLAFMPQGGSVEEMDEADVVAGSPLAAWLYGLRGHKARGAPAPPGCDQGGAQ